ncbi:5-hydroxytryptamine receptor 1D-like [Pollicipes pollicipes]|uniref:5-hydroxytryptamine receptor 1D-like n=1 Tax=Pollicipes pollicipes TaxID=41117 RepID=UPI0018855D92|nr:5-hydroxytryptamine receptor 1D-like [Pollicipes pollicipes]
MAAMNACTISKQALLGWPEDGYSLCPGHTPVTVIVLTALYCFTFLASVLANGFLIFALSQTSKSLQCRNYIVVSQCASDMLVTLLCMPDTVASRLSASWQLGEAWCRASPLLHVLAVAASTYSLMMLSLDRCLAMKSPKMFNQGERRRLAPRCRPPLLRSTSSYSLKTRQQLANTLVVLVVVFAACWLPFTLAGLAHLVYASRPTALLLPFALLLGHAHSAVNPVVYSLVHRASLTQVQRSLRVPRLPVSSTNLGNLGPFHPKYLPARNLLNPNPVVEERRTSQFFH